MNLLFVTLFLIFGIVLEIKYRVHLFTSLKNRILVIGFIFVVLMGWELINFHFFQAWIYLGEGMIGIKILGLPIELYLFFITSPYFSLVVYELIHKEVDED